MRVQAFVYVPVCICVYMCVHLLHVCVYVHVTCVHVCVYVSIYCLVLDVLCLSCERQGLSVFIAR